MKRKLFHYGLLVLLVVTTGAAFSVSRHLNRHHGEAHCTNEWLCMSGRQCQRIREEDPGFKEESQSLSQGLLAHQQALIALIQDADAQDGAIRVQAQSVVDTHHKLMRRVVEHFLVVRRYADSEQSLRLNGLCSGALGGHGLGRGQGRLTQENHGGGRGPHGRGRGQGLGRGMGRGRGWGHLAPALALTEDQQQQIAEQDPNFEEESVVLTEDVQSLHNAFLQKLTDANVTDTAIDESLDALIDAREKLEQRTIEHVLRLRPLLSPDQQQHLIGLSQRGCRWRGGRHQATE